PGRAMNFDAPKFTTKTPVATAIEQLKMGDEIGKFLQPSCSRRYRTLNGSLRQDKRSVRGCKRQRRRSWRR
ncbi:MAG: hypothetical protein EZS28_042534, partial [Streblomastix strix]